MEYRHRDEDEEPLPEYVEVGPDLSPEEIAIIDQNNDRSTPARLLVIKTLFTAISGVSHDDVTQLLTQFPNYVSANSRDKQGKTVLAAAVETGNMRMVEMLINAGADVDAYSVQGEYEIQKELYEKRVKRNNEAFLRLRMRGNDARAVQQPQAEWEEEPGYMADMEDMEDGEGDPRRMAGDPRRMAEDPGYMVEEPAPLYPDYQILRTPLMIAAEKGYLAIVKLLFNPPCNADGGLCAPDGQIALRLASENGHREIVQFLPAVRKGGWGRFKHQHATSVYRVIQITDTLRIIGAVLFYYIPKAVLYQLPKWIAQQLFKLVKWVVLVEIPYCGRAIARNTIRGASYMKNEFPGLTKRATKAAGKAIWNFFTTTLPKATVAFGKYTWKVVSVDIPNAAVETAKFLWKCFSNYLPRAIKATAKAVGRFLWSLITEWFPAFCKAVGHGLVALSRGTWELLVRGLSVIASFIHSVFTAIFTLLRSISLKDIWNGFVRILEWLFVDVPKAIWKGVLALHVAVGKGLRKVFGWMGTVIVYLYMACVVCLLHVPARLGEALVEYSKVVGRGFKEILVWFNPKR